MKVLRIGNVKLPTRANPKDAGMDFFVPNDFTSVTLQPNESVLIPSGIKVCVPEGHALIAFNKSGVSTKRNIIKGAEVIDEPYQGQIHIHLFNIGKEPQVINAGDKIIQLICLPVNYCTVEEVFDEVELYNGLITTRGEGGFGSTGTK